MLPSPPARRLAGASGPRVLVLSYNNVGNFGDRLGFHLVGQVLPPNARVTWSHFRPFDAPDEPFDLLVLGIGNSLFGPLLTPDLLRLLDRVPRVVGVFGTQYREEIPNASMASVIDRLTLWMARYADDVALYGSGRDNVMHLGDWLVTAFPMAEAPCEERLSIGDEIWADLPLDLVISTIQRYREVYSTRLHPLLCALTSAHRVAYSEQREHQGLASGKFRSLLLDVFGQVYEENEMFEVDRRAVAAYKARVQAAMLHLRDQVARMLDVEPVTGAI